MNSKPNLSQSGLALSACLISTAHAEVTLDGSLGTTPPLTGPNYEIIAEMGETQGNNLFHSFSQFDLTKDESVNFSGPDNIQNIFSRVTGNNPSNIDGTISSSIDGANLFLMNPHGILFGPNAQVNITGSFHATSADYLKFGDNEHFYADLNQNTTLSVAAASAFGFLDENNGDITFNGTQLKVNEGNTLSVIGGNILLTEDTDEDGVTKGAMLRAPDGQINLASAASKGETTIALGNTDLSAFENFGDISLGSESDTNGSSIDASGNTGGRVVIRGGQLALQISTISADTTAFAAQLERNVDIKTKQSLSVDKQSKISADLKIAAAGTPGGISIETHQLNVQNQSAIQAEAEFLSTGDAGNITIDAKHIDLDKRSKISTTTNSTGNSGTITITKAETLNIKNASAIITAADLFLGEGESNNIDIHANYINIIGLENPANPELFDFTGIFGGDFTGIDAGNSVVNTNNTGNIDIYTKDLTLSNNALIRTQTAFGFTSGDININSHNLTVDSGSKISSQSFATNNSGFVTINNKNHVLITGTSSTANQISHRFRKSTIATSGGNSNIFIKSGSIKISDGAQIKNEAQFAGTGSGNITLHAGSIEITGINQKIFEATVANGNDIDTAIDRAQSKVSSSATVEASFALNGGSGGSIVLTADNFILSDQAAIETEANGVLLSPTNTGESGNIEIYAKIAAIRDAEINAQAQQSNGGNIEIIGDKALIIEGTHITSSVETNNGNGGNIVTKSDLLVLDKSNITATAFAGKGGNIDITANTLAINDTNVIDASSEVGIDGNKNINSTIDIENNVEKLPTTMTDPTKLFTNSCNVALQDTQSSLTTFLHYTQGINKNAIPSEYRQNLTQNKNMNRNQITLAASSPNKSLVSFLRQDNNASCQKSIDLNLNQL